jgi:hypothetical protein
MLARESLKILTELEANAVQVLKLVESQSTVCKSQELIRAMNLDSILKEGVLGINLPTPDYYVGVGNDPLVLFNNVYSNLFAAGAEHQNSEFSDAVKRAPSKMITSEEIRATSEKSCNSLMASYTDFHGDTAKSLQTLITFIQRSREALQIERTDPEYRLLKKVAKRIEEGATVEDQLKSSGTTLQSVKLPLDLFELQRDVMKREELVAGAQSCVPALSRLETLQSALVEAEVQVDALIFAQMGKSAASALGTAKAFLISSKERSEATAKSVKARLCQ